MQWFEHHRALIEGVGAAILCLENILPHTPGRVNSTLQLLVAVAKLVTPKKEQK